MKRTSSSFCDSSAFPLPLGPINNVSEDIYLQIFKNSSAEFLICTAPLVCKQWHKILQEEVKWQYLFLEHYPCSSSTAEKYKKRYENEFRVSRNLASGMYTSTQLQAHDDCIINLFTWKDTLVSCSRRVSPEVKLFSINNIKEGSIAKTLFPLLLNFGWDEVYDNFLLTREGARVVTALHAEGKLYRGSYRNIDVLDLNSKETSRLDILGEAAQICSLAICEDILRIKYFEMAEKTFHKILLFNLKTQASISLTLDPRFDSGKQPLSINILPLQQLHLKNMMISVIRDHKLEIINLRNGSVTYKSFKKEGITSVAMVNGRLVIGTSSGKVGIYNNGLTDEGIDNIQEMTCTFLEPHHKGKIEHLLSLGHGKMISVCEEQTLFIWDFNAASPVCTAQLHELEAPGDPQPDDFTSPMLYRDGKLFIGDPLFIFNHSPSGLLRILDFNAEAHACFAELAGLFSSGLEQLEAQGNTRFDRIPRKEKQHIYREMATILQKDEVIDSSTWKMATCTQKAEAIRNYLKTRRVQ